MCWSCAVPHRALPAPGASRNPDGGRWVRQGPGGGGDAHAAVVAWLVAGFACDPGRVPMSMTWQHGSARSAGSAWGGPASTHECMTPAEPACTLHAACGPADALRAWTCRVLRRRHSPLLHIRSRASAPAPPGQRLRCSNLRARKACERQVRSVLRFVGNTAKTMQLQLQLYSQGMADWPPFAPARPPSKSLVSPLCTYTHLPAGSGPPARRLYKLLMFGVASSSPAAPASSAAGAAVAAGVDDALGEGSDTGAGAGGGSSGSGLGPGTTTSDFLHPNMRMVKFEKRVARLGWAGVPKDIHLVNLGVKQAVE